MKKTIAIVVMFTLVVSTFVFSIAEPITDYNAYIDAIMSQYEGSYESFGKHIHFREGNFAVSPTGQFYYNLGGETVEILFTKTDGVNGRRVIYAKYSNGSYESFLEEK